MYLGELFLGQLFLTLLLLIELSHCVGCIQRPPACRITAGKAKKKK
jgi:hypothetical protein